MRLMPLIGIHYEGVRLAHSFVACKPVFDLRFLFIGAIFLTCLCLSCRSAYGYEHLVQYSFTIQNRTSDFVTSLDFACFKPANTFRQKVLSITTSPPCIKDTDQLKSSLLHFHIRNIAPFGTSIVRISAKLEIKSSGNSPAGQAKTAMERGEEKGWLEKVKSFFAPTTREKAKDADDLKAFLLPSRFIESAHPEIIALARRLRGKTPVDTTRKLYEWVKGNIVYPGYAGNIKGALQTLRQGKGDCTGQAALFVALCRACNIPARPVTGFVCPNNCVLNPAALHNWAEFKTQGQWHIADPQGGNFMEHEAYYMEMECNTGNYTSSAEVSQSGCLDLVRFRVEDHAGVRVLMNRE